MGPTVILTGTPGVGKSSIISELASQAEKEGIRLNIVNYGTAMMKRLESHGRKIHRDEIRKQDITIQSKIQLETAKEISKMRGEEVLVVDTHTFIRTPRGAFPGIPLIVLQVLEPSVLILVEANPEQIAKRRSGDNNRKRDQQTLEDVNNDLEWSRKTAAACAVVAGIPVSIIRNEDKHQNEAARKVLEIIKEII